MADEELLDVGGGSVCARKCTQDSDCPTDVVQGIDPSWGISCGLPDWDEYEGYCVVQCLEDNQCDSDHGALCKNNMGFDAICAYRDLATVLV